MFLRWKCLEMWTCVGVCKMTVIYSVGISATYRHNEALQVHISQLHTHTLRQACTHMHTLIHMHNHTHSQPYIFGNPSKSSHQIVFATGTHKLFLRFNSSFNSLLWLYCKQMVKHTCTSKISTSWSFPWHHGGKNIPQLYGTNFQNTVLCLLFPFSFPFIFSSFLSLPFHLSLPSSVALGLYCKYTVVFLPV